MAICSFGQRSTDSHAALLRLRMTHPADAKWQFTEAAWSDGFGRCVRVTRLRFAQGNMEKALGVTAWSGADQKVAETVFVIFSACGAGDRQRQVPICLFAHKKPPLPKGVMKRGPLRANKLEQALGRCKYSESASCFLYTARQKSIRREKAI